MIVPKALEKTYAPSVQDQMRNTEIAYAKNRRAQKKFERELYGPFGIETIRKHKLTNIDDERGMLEYELQRMHREAKKNALLAEAEGRIQARAEKNTQVNQTRNAAWYNICLLQTVSSSTAKTRFLELHVRCGTKPRHSK